MAEKKISFEPKPGSPTVTRVSHGEYTREFDFGPHGSAGSPPWEADEAEWSAYLVPTGFFREIKKESLTMKDTKVTKEKL